MIEHLQLFNNVNVNPIPLEFNQSMSTTKILAGIEAKINTIIDLYNKANNEATAYTDSQFKVLKDSFTDLVNQVKNGAIIQDGSIDLSKLNTSFISDLHELIVNTVHDSSKFVTFGLDDTGRFVSYIPSTWEDLVFSTSEIGELTLDLKEE